MRGRTVLSSTSRATSSPPLLRPGYTLNCAPESLAYTMSSMGLLLLSRILPVFLMVGSAYILPWASKTYLITGLSGANFQQTDVSNCDIIYPDVLVGCEDVHVYNAPSGPMIFTGCVEKITDQFVLSLSSPPKMKAKGCRLGFQELRRGIKVERDFMKPHFIFMNPQ